jgi:hypothetical protein
MGRKRRKTWDEIVAGSPFLSFLEREKRRRLAETRPIEETLAPLVERAAWRWVECCSEPFVNDDDDKGYRGCLADVVGSLAEVSCRDLVEETGLSEDREDEAWDAFLAGLEKRTRELCASVPDA